MDLRVLKICTKVWYSKIHLEWTKVPTNKNTCVCVCVNIYVHILVLEAI